MDNLRVKLSESGQRIDQYLKKQFDQYSRSFWSNMIKQGKVKVNKTFVSPSYQVKKGDSIGVEMPKKPKPTSIPIIYEDDDLFVIEKPHGILTHSKGSINLEYTVADFAKSKAPRLKGNRGGIVHRLDRDTSGVMVVAKNEKTMRFLQKQFANRKVHKTYIALVHGQVKDDEFKVEMPIARNPKKPSRFKVDKAGKEAITHFRTLERGERFSLVEATPITGRTHQLRVHLLAIGNPIAGDRFYGVSDEFDRLMLHASSLELTLPGGKRKKFESQVPNIFLDAVK